MGSIRIPSAYCGVAGHKPGYGLVPSQGLIDLSPTLDHVGPHARIAADLAIVMAAFGCASRPLPHRTLRIGAAAWKGAIELEQGVADAFASALETLRSFADVKSVDVSGIEFGALRRKGLLISEVEGYAAHQEALAVSPEGFSPSFTGMLDWGRRATGEEIEEARAAIRTAGERLAALLDGVDVLVMPTAPQGPFPFEAPPSANQADFTALANFAGFPATAVPATATGAPPASIQFIARKGEDAMALAVAIEFEARRGPAPAPPIA